MENFFKNISSLSSQEIFTTLLTGKNFKLERIVSTGQATPAGEWLCSPQAEWVIVLQGQAKLKFRDEAVSRSLTPGDHLTIPANIMHRVDGTDPSGPTVWLALHYSS